jgi:GT2 family glycosyltransferase
MESVSVVIPTLNRARYLDGCLAALADLDYPKDRYEVVVVDGGSTDETPNIVKHHEGKFSSLKFLVERKRGSSSARNLGFRNIENDYVALTDDDALVSKDWLKNLMSNAGKDKVLVGKVVSHLTGKVQYGCRRSTFIGGSIRLPFFLKRYANSGCTCNMFVPKNVWLKVGGFDEELIAAFDDSSFCLRALQNGYKVQFAEEAVVFHKRELRRSERFALHIMYRTYGMLKIYSDSPAKKTLFVILNSAYVCAQCFLFLLKYDWRFATDAFAAMFEGHKLYKQNSELFLER